MNTKEIFAGNLKKLRVKKGWSREEMATVIGVKYKTYSSYEEGRAKPSIDTLLKIIEVGGVTDIKAFLTSNFSRINTKPISIQTKYDPLKGKEKRAVNVLLGIN